MSIYQFSGSVIGLLAATLLHGIALGIVLALVLLVTAVVSSLAALKSTAVVTASAPLRLNSAARTVIASRSLINLGFYTLFGFLFFFVRESLGVADPRTTTGILFLAFTIAGIAGAAIAGRPADRIDKRVVVSIACAAIAIAVGAFALAPTVALALVCAIGAGAAWGAFFTADWAIAYAVLPASALAAAMGVWNLAAALPQVLAPLLTAHIVDAVDARHYGAGPRVALALVVVEFILGTVWLWRLRMPAANSLGARERYDDLRRRNTAALRLDGSLNRRQSAADDHRFGRRNESSVCECTRQEVAVDDVADVVVDETAPKDKPRAHAAEQRFHHERGHGGRRLRDHRKGGWSDG